MATLLLFGCEAQLQEGSSSLSSAFFSQEESTSLFNASDKNSNVDPKTNCLLVEVTEEEQFEESDSVVIVRCLGRGTTMRFSGENDEIPHTLYRVKTLKILKGEYHPIEISLYGDTTPCATVAISVEEKMKIGQVYKAYLRLKEGYFVTTAGFQSIILLRDYDSSSASSKAY